MLHKKGNRFRGFLFYAHADANMKNYIAVFHIGIMPLKWRIGGALYGMISLSSSRCVPAAGISSVSSFSSIMDSIVV